MATRRRVKQVVVTLLKLGVAAGLLAWLLRSGKLEPAKIWQAIRANPVWLAVAFAVYNVCIVLTALRWRMLLLSQGLHPTHGACVRMTYTGCFFSCFLPGGTGGDLVKAYYVARDTHKRAEAVTTVFLDRVLGLYCMVGLAAVALLFHIGDLWHYEANLDLSALGLTAPQLLVVGVLAGFAAATAGFVVFLTPRCRRLVHYLLGHLPRAVGSVLKRVYEAVYLYRDQRVLLVKFALYSVAAHSLAAGVLWVCGLALNDPVAHGGARAFNYLFLSPLGVVLNGMPVAPAGVGVFEWALGFLFGAVLAPGEANLGATVGALGHIVFILTNLIGVVFYIRGKRRVVEALHEADSEAASPVTPEPAASAHA
jgi:uncharacterized protein (TIRG00374 family)